MALPSERRSRILAYDPSGPRLFATPPQPTVNSYEVEETKAAAGVVRKAVKDIR